MDAMPSDHEFSRQGPEAASAGPLVLEVYDHHPACPVKVDELARRGREALPLCLAVPASGVLRVLPDLEEIEVSLVTDDDIARVHGEYLDDPTPTDVITFHHGEILISADTAEREAAGHGHPADREALLYLIHGLLHLNGHDDHAEPDRQAMHAAQEEILAAVWPV